MAKSALATFPQEGLWRVAALLHRRPGISEEDFAAGLSDELAPAMMAAVEKPAGPFRLVIDHRPSSLDPKVDGLFPPLFDGLIGLWFESVDDAIATMRAMDASADVRRIAGELIDAERSTVWLAEVFPIKREEGGSHIKFLAGGDAAEGWDMIEAQRYWRDVHPVVAQTAPTVWGPLTRYVQFHGRSVPPALAGQHWLGRWKLVPLCAEMGFADGADFVTNYSNEEYRTIVRPDEEKFSRPGEMLAFVTGEQREFVAA